MAAKVAPFLAARNKPSVGRNEPTMPALFAALILAVVYRALALKRSDTAFRKKYGYPAV